MPPRVPAKAHLKVPEVNLAPSAAERWPDRLAALALACAAGSAGDEPQRIRDLRDLLIQAPCSAARCGTSLPPSDEFETQLDARASVSAVLSLLGHDCGYLLSRGSQGEHMASVILPGRADESTASADSAALALVAALAMALQDAPLLFGAFGDAEVRPALRFN